MTFEFPKRGFVFWPVGTGDSTSIVIDSETIVQVDLRHLDKSDDDDDPAWSVVDELVKRLPKKDGRPYLAVFALSHPDEDHCKGFEKLLSSVTIGTLWFTPRIFGEHTKDLCDDAEAFKSEAKRRVEATLAAGRDPGAGDRVRIFGFSELLNMSAFSGFPTDLLTVPGGSVSIIDGVDRSGDFVAFVHAPFKDDDAGERNDTSLGIQVTLFEGDARLRALLLGDLKYPIIKRIFELSEPDDLAWNVLLAPHHCSKSVMYWQEEGDEEEKLKQGLLDKIGGASENPNCIVSSSNPVPDSNESGDNPPHANAKKRYETLTSRFVCTMESPNKANPEPVVVKFEGGKIMFSPGGGGSGGGGKSASESASDARGTDDPPADAVTYG